MASLNPVSGTLGTQRAAHLLRRALFGPTRQEISSFSGMTVQAAVNQLLQAQPAPAPPVDPLTMLPWNNPSPGVGNSDQMDLVEHTLAWWLSQMHKAGPNITERMVYFYHTHIPSILSRLNNVMELYNQLELYRYYALGNYKEMMRAIIIDNAMLLNLDGVQNVNGLPQENFAREYLELFTVGKGLQVGPGDYTTFTEQDVQAATKVFTGWEVDYSFTNLDPVTNIPRGRLKGNGQVASQHDPSTKTFSAAFGNTTITPGALQGGFATVAAAEQEITDLVNMIFTGPNAARHLCRKLYRCFVYWDITPEIETDIIVPLAQTLINNNYNIPSALSQLLQSEHFYDTDDQVTSNDNFGAIIKSPVDLTVGTWRALHLVTPNPSTQLVSFYEAYRQGIRNQTADMGQDLYEPYDVAGYDAYHQFPGYNRNWISANYLANRYKYSEDLITTGFQDIMGNVVAKLDVVDYVENQISNPLSATIVVQELIDLLFPIQINQTRFDFFLNDIFLENLPPNNWTNEWNVYIVSGNDATVRTQLEKLFTALMQCPEFQLY